MSRRKRARSNTSRTIATVALFVLVSIALTGIVLALRRPPADAEEKFLTPEASIAMTPAAPMPAASSSEAPLAPPSLPSMSAVQFEGSSDDLPAGADARLVVVAAAARAQRHGVFINALATTGSHSDESVALARRRLAVLRRALLANGLPLEDVHLQISPVPPGATTPTRLALVDLMVR